MVQRPFPLRLRRRGSPPAPVESPPVTRRGARLRGVLRDFARTKRSAVALELAAAALPFFMLFLGTMEVSYDLYVQSALNYGVSETARQIWEGTIQSADSTAGGQSFVSNFMCPNVAGLLDCSLIQVNIQRIPSTTDYWNFATPAYVTGSGPGATLATSSWSVCTGGPNNPVLFQAVYAGPTFVGGFIPAFVVSYGGGLIHPTYASHAFVNQGFTSTVGC